jgi:hypothetical protein
LQHGIHPSAEDKERYKGYGQISKEKIEKLKIPGKYLPEEKSKYCASEKNNNWGALRKKSESKEKSSAARKKKITGRCICKISKKERESTKQRVEHVHLRFCSISQEFSAGEKAEGTEEASALGKA